MLKALSGEFVADAVNVSGGRVGEEVSAWLDLSRKLGLIAGKLLGGAPVSLEVTARGELSSEDVDVLALAAVRGLFSGITEDAVTFVNAPTIAEERGLDYSVTTATESVSHRSVLEVRVFSADGQSASVTGALTGLDRVEKIVRINDRGLDLRASGRNLFLRYSDVPGALGKAGSRVGDAGINIDAAALSQTADGEGAILILRVESEVPDNVVNAIAVELDAEAFQIDLD